MAFGFWRFIVYFNENLEENCYIYFFKLSAMLKNLGTFVIFLLGIQWATAQNCGPYQGITHLSNITGSCVPTTLAVLGDTNFSSNGGVEIPMFTSFSGTWADGLGYTDAPGPEMLCVSYHTQESWDVQLVLSNATTTAPQSAVMSTILDYVVWDMYDCSATLYPGFNYDRRIALLDFSSYTIPAGVTVVGAIFTLTSDNAVNPDPVGILLIGGNTLLNIGNNGPLCTGDTLELYADHPGTATFNWSGPLGFTSVLEDPIIPNVTTAHAGQYTCIITDSANVDTFYTNVIIHPNPQADFVLPATCENQSGTYSITNATDTITSYLWDFGTTALNDTSNLASPVFTYTNNGTYNINLLITSDEGCTATIDTNVTVHGLPLVNLSNSFACTGAAVTFDPFTIGDGPLSYNWTFPSGSPATSTDSIVSVIFATSGTPLINLILTTSFGCADTFNFPFVVNNGVSPLFGVYPICISRFTFDPIAGVGDSLWVLDWDMGDGTQFNNVDTSIFNYLYQSPGTYNVQMIVTTAIGCIDTISIPVVVEDTISINMPNLLIHSSSVNNNKIDFEVLKPGFNLCIAYTYSIYDRWGTLVFETINDPLNPDVYCSDCFRGKTKSGNDLTAGTYYYILKGNFNILQQGFLTIFD